MDAYATFEEHRKANVIQLHVEGQLFVFAGGAPLGFPPFQRWWNTAPLAGLSFRIDNHAILVDLGWLWRDAFAFSDSDEWLRDVLDEDVRVRWVDEAAATIDLGAPEMVVTQALRSWLSGQRINAAK